MCAHRHPPHMYPILPHHMSDFVQTFRFLYTRVAPLPFHCRQLDSARTMDGAGDFDDIKAEGMDVVNAEAPAAATSSSLNTTLTVPKGSVKRVIKLDKDVKMVAADAVFLMTKATVRFGCAQWLGRPSPNASAQ